MSVTRIFDILNHQISEFPLDTALAGKVKGDWKRFSSEDFRNHADWVSLGLIGAGLEPGDKVAIISNNRPEWNFVDMGTLQAGGVDVPIYPTASENDLKFILNDADVRFIFVSSAELFTKARKCAEGCKTLKEIFTFDKVEGAKHWSEILKSGKSSGAKTELDTRRSNVRPNDLATILYTSGTTGTPKGVMLSHDNLVSNFIAVRHLPPTDPGDIALSFLPLNHIYERMLTYMYMYIGISIYYAESIETIGDNIKEVRPHVFSAVPRLLEKVYEKIVAKGSLLTGIKRHLFFLSIKLGEQYDPGSGNGILYKLQLALVRKLVFSKWKEGLGGNVKAIVSGGAALNPRLARIFWAAGINVLEGYGCTETSPVIAVNNLEPGGMQIGTVGPVIESVEVKIAEDGEILCKGPNVMLGYYKRQDLTSEAIDADGYYHTGDIGEIVDGRYLKITDRKKEIFKTSGGKYIAPQMIENKLKESRFIEQVMVVGDGQKYASALIVPSFETVREWADKNNIDLGDGGKVQIANDPQVKKRIMQEVKRVNSSLAQYETIKKIQIIPEEWTIERGEITPKLSLKRKVILDKHRDFMEKIYRDV
jgi:long-chain acyl-CoA synthetase